MLGMVAQKSTM